MPQKKRKKKTARQRKGPAYLVWIQTSFLGDLVLTTGAMSLAQKIWPETKQILITTPLGENLLKGHSALHKIISMEKSGVGFRSFFEVLDECREYIEDRESAVTLLPHRSLRSALLAKMIGLPTVGYRESSLPWLLSHAVDRVSVFHESIRIGLLLEPLGVSREEITTAKLRLEHDMNSNDAWMSESRSFPKVSQWIGIAPGSVWGTKRWPAKHFAWLINLLAEAYPEAGFVLIGSREEIRASNEVMSSIDRPPAIINLVGRTSLQQMSQVIARLALLVANDSAPVHFASAWNTPTVELFGATSSAMGFGPLSDKSAVCEIDLDCRPCSDHGPKICPLGHFQCMKGMSPTDVFLACRQLLNQT